MFSREFLNEEQLEARTMSAPFFRVRKERQRILTEGSPRCLLPPSIRTETCTDADLFASWDWDGRRLTVRNDRYGFYPLFYSCRDGELIVSPSLLKLLMLGGPREIDTAALAAFLRMDCFLAEDTPFRGIRLVPPNAAMFWEDGELEISGRYLIGRMQTISRDAAIDGFIDLFRVAIRRRLPEGPAAVPLSGGRDSRHIILELYESGAPPDAAITVRHEPHILTQDVEVAERLAAELGVRHVVVHVPQAVLQLEWRKNIETHFCTREHAWILPLADHIIEERFSVVYEGVAGDHLSAAFRNNPQRQAWFESDDLDRLAEDLLTEGHLSKALPARQFRLATREVAKARLIAELRKHANAPNQLASFIFWNRARRVTGLSPTSILGRAAKVWCPYLDRDLFDFLITLPARMLLDHTFHTDTIYRAYPRYANVPFAPASQRRRAPRHERKVLSDLSRLALAKSRSILLRKSFLLPRLLRALVDPIYLSEMPGFAKFCLYLLQLEQYAP